MRGRNIARRSAPLPALLRRGGRSPVVGGGAVTPPPAVLSRIALVLSTEGVSVSGINSHSTALRFFLKVTLKRGEEVDRIPILREHRRMPVVFTPEEVARIIACAPGLKYRTALSVTYGAGLRASETASLKVSNIDSRTMTLSIEQGKGYKDRKAKLSPQLLEALRKWWQITRPQV